MAGTKIGGLKAKAKNLAKDPYFYKKCGQKGGSKCVPKGFARMTPEKVSAAGRKGGAVSRRKSR